MSQSLRDRIAELEAENAKYRESMGAGDKVRFKVGARGGMSMYGFGRFPVTLYVEQWEKLLENVDLIKEALKKHEKELKRRD